MRYIDLAAAVKDENGDLPETSHIGDGYHLSKDALEDVLMYIRTHAYQ